MAIAEDLPFASPIPRHKYTSRLSNLNRNQRAWLVKQYLETFSKWGVYSKEETAEDDAVK